MNVGQEDQHTGKVLTALGDAKFKSLFDRVGGVAARIGQANDLGFGSLGLQQEG